MSQQKPDDHIEIEIDLDGIDATSAETKATYKQIQEWVLNEYGFKVTHLNIAQVKQKYGIIERENYNKAKCGRMQSAAFFVRIFNHVCMFDKAVSSC